MINCGETRNGIFLEIVVFDWLTSDWCHVWSWLVYHIDPTLNFFVILLEEKREENNIQAYIRQLVWELIKWYFQALVGHTCCLLFINHGSADSLRSVLQVCQFILVYAKISKAFFCASFSPLHIAFYQLSALDIPCFLWHTAIFLLF